MSCYYFFYSPTSLLKCPLNHACTVSYKNPVKKIVNEKLENEKLCKTLKRCSYFECSLEIIWNFYLPCRGSQAAIMFLASNICWVNSGTVKDLYCWLPRDVNGANPGMKKWSLGKGTMLTANFRKSAFNWPGNLRQVVTPKI